MMMKSSYPTPVGVDLHDPGLDGARKGNRSRYTHLPVVVYVNGVAVEHGCTRIRRPTMADGAIHVEPLVGPGMGLGFNDQFPWR